METFSFMSIKLGKHEKVVFYLALHVQSCSKHQKTQKSVAFYRKSEKSNSLVYSKRANRYFALKKD